MSQVVNKLADTVRILDTLREDRLPKQLCQLRLNSIMEREALAIRALHSHSPKLSIMRIVNLSPTKHDSQIPK